MRATLGLLAVCALACASQALAAGKPTDPRKCLAVTPGGAPKHAFWCAHAAAIEQVRSTMAKQQHVARWYAPTFCAESGSALHWSCSSILGGHVWKGQVVYRATSAGWRVTVSMVKQP